MAFWILVAVLFFCATIVQEDYEYYRQYARQSRSYILRLMNNVSVSDELAKDTWLFLRENGLFRKYL